MDRTLVILKPDALQRQLAGTIIARFERKGLQIVACKLMTISRDLAETHYAAHKGKTFYDPLIDFIVSGPVMAIVFQGPKAIQIARKLMGSTFGCDAEPGTIRGDFGCSNSFNLIHGSDSVESAAAEIELFFSDNELCQYEFDHAAWIYGRY